MALHRAEQIMAALLTTLKAITSPTVAAINMQRDRVDPFETLPAISLEEGADILIEGSDENVSKMDSILNIEVIVHAKKLSGVSTQLNQIRKEVYIALMADITQGLSFVNDTRYQGAEKPLRFDEAENAAMQQTIDFEIKYRHSLTDPSAD
jgi:hypothetical protein